jgi:hypothetical protein
MAVLVVDVLDMWVLIIASPFSKSFFFPVLGCSEQGRGLGSHDSDEASIGS